MKWSVLKRAATEARMDVLAMELFGRTRRETLAAQECLRCRKSVNADELAINDAIEYGISGFCPACFAEVTSDGDV